MLRMRSATSFFGGSSAWTSVNRSAANSSRVWPVRASGVVELDEAERFDIDRRRCRRLPGGDRLPMPSRCRNASSACFRPLMSWLPGDSFPLCLRPADSDSFRQDETGCPPLMRRNSAVCGCPFPAPARRTRRTRCGRPATNRANRSLSGAAPGPTMPRRDSSVDLKIALLAQHRVADRRRFKPPGARDSFARTPGRPPGRRRSSSSRISNSTWGACNLPWPVSECPPFGCPDDAVLCNATLCRCGLYRPILSCAGAMRKMSPPARLTQRLPLALPNFWANWIICGDGLDQVIVYIAVCRISGVSH